MTKTEVIPMPHLLARNITRMRRERSLTQRSVAKELGIKLCTYQSYEERRAEPPTMILFKLAHLYKVDNIKELFY